MYGLFGLKFFHRSILHKVTVNLYKYLVVVAFGLWYGSCMRHKRVKLKGDAIYHCMSRVVDRRYIFGDREKARFVEMMRRQEAFSGVRILSYCLMSNHFHLLLEVPDREELGPDDLLGRIAALYGPVRRKEVLELLEKNPSAAEDILRPYLNRMYDLSYFMRELKQRFSMWYNRVNNRRGTLWEERFKSVVVEDTHTALLTMAAYIELNPVRAGICEDPKDYRWNSYGAAVAKEQAARDGITRIYELLQRPTDWRTVARRYRVKVFTSGRQRGIPVGDGRRQGGEKLRAGISRERVQRVIDEGGKLGQADLLRCRVRYMSDGMVLGSREFVDDFFESQREIFGSRRKSGARKMRGGDWNGLCTVRDLQVEVIQASQAFP